jgi:hypothetical protein
MGDPKEEVKPCDREPCKGDLIACERARAACVAAASAAQTALDSKPTGKVVGAALLGAALAAAGGLIVWTGLGTLPGAGLIAAGAASGAGGAKLFKDWRELVKRKRADCATAHAAYLAAKEAVMKDCPNECWPKPFGDCNCP